MNYFVDREKITVVNCSFILEIHNCQHFYLISADVFGCFQILSNIDRQLTISFLKNVKNKVTAFVKFSSHVTNENLQ